ncbi:NADH dehydrogenase [ubiquinone] 1 alpha subcomplex assembly factor 2-like [Penaeus japonicus]|uniref:NADH dehydrogenase [ubiquinone] 1 alpha subcomplex assembly factor 2-like n=1 Tax=Penaeus japonicus TaxID=27405 RepID=UPI001C70BEA2|nr:NADH dehydrogenase [ubiquinone] 1 alpha subcomplex assembly factor 2-like [Penaeus japonicus]
MSGKTRSLFGTAFKHFINSLKPRQTSGVLIGDDYYGNKFYEIPADPRRGKRYAKRWYVPPVDMQYDQKHMPAEWDAWLRNRRAEPPSEAELKENLTLSIMKKENADKLAVKAGKNPEELVKHSDMSSFPVYDDYEVTPGDGAKHK